MNAIIYNLPPPPTGCHPCLPCLVSFFLLPRLLQELCRWYLNRPSQVKFGVCSLVSTLRFPQFFDDPLPVASPFQHSCHFSRTFSSLVNLLAVFCVRLSYVTFLSIAMPENIRVAYRRWVWIAFIWNII